MMMKITRLSLTLLLFYHIIFASHAYALKGDVAPLNNPDGAVTVADALVTLRIGLGLLNSHYPAADVAPLDSPDNKVTVADALVTLRVALRLVSLPVELKAPTKANLISVSSIDGDKITVNWMPAEDDLTPQSALKYAIHVSAEEGFIPEATTLKLLLTDAISASIDGLEANTTYFIKVVVIDKDDQVSWSNELSVKTVATVLQTTAATVHVQTTDQLPQVEASQITYQLTQASVPVSGEYLISAEGGGYLRKVTQVSQNNETVVVTTESASLNELFDELELSASIKLISVPDNQPVVKTVAQSLQGNGAPTSVRQRKMQWPDSGLTLFDSNIDSRALTAASQLLIDGAVQTLDADSVILTAPAFFTLEPNDWTNFIVYAKAKDNYQVCQIEWVELTHPDDNKQTLLATDSPVAPTSLAYDADKQASYLNLLWTPKEQHVDDGGLPYQAVFRITTDQASGDCEGSSVGGYTDDLELKVPVYIQVGELVAKATKSIEFGDGGDFTITDEVTFEMAPEFEIAATISNASLEKATMVVQTNIEFQQNLHIQATGVATFEQEKQLLAPRKFTKVFATGSVPIVVSGEFGIKVRVSANAKGVLSLDEVIRLAYPNARFGLTYDRVNQWQVIQEFEPEYQFTLNGEGDTGVDVTITLIPDLQIHVYEAASGRMLVEPTLFSQATIQGQMAYDDTLGNVPADLNYWFTQLEVGSGLNLRLYAGLDIFDSNMVSYPVGVTLDDPDNFALFNVIGEEGCVGLSCPLVMAGLPELTAVLDETRSHPDNSRSFYVTGHHNDIQNPLFTRFNLGPESYLPFKRWTAPELVTNRTGAVIIPVENTEAEYWFQYETAPGDYEIRLSGYSTLGQYIRQITSINYPITDDDNDGIADQWERAHGVYVTAPTADGLDPQADPDNDGRNNLQEFLDGTYPYVNDASVTSILSMTDQSVVEGNEGNTLVTFTVMLSPASADVIEVDYVTLDATATQVDQDYVPTQGTLRFLPGDIQRTFSVTVLGDDKPEPDEVLTVRLSNVKNAAMIAKADVNLLITNDDGAVYGELNDTGIVVGDDTDNTRNSDCSGNTVNQQDCASGRDVIYADNSDGHAGFSFTKLDESGNSLPASAAQWSCVKDNVTGLVWEVKTDDAGLHDRDDVYYWYTTDISNDGGFEGNYNESGATCYGYQLSDASTYCNTEAYVNRVNQQGLCGANDWYLPSRNELESLVSFDRSYPSIDTSYFPNTISAHSWSSSANANYSQTAWGVYFNVGGSSTYGKDTGFAVRLVRVGQ